MLCLLMASHKMMEKLNKDKSSRGNCFIKSYIKGKRFAFYNKVQRKICKAIRKEDLDYEDFGQE